MLTLVIIYLFLGILTTRCYVYYTCSINLVGGLILTLVWPVTFVSLFVTGLFELSSNYNISDISYKISKFLFGGKD